MLAGKLTVAAVSASRFLAFVTRATQPAPFGKWGAVALAGGALVVDGFGTTGLGTTALGSMTVPSIRTTMLNEPALLLSVLLNSPKCKT